MRSLILESTAKFISPFMLVIAFYLLLRGHNDPGGGFAGGLVAAAALALNMVASGHHNMRKALKVDPRTLAGIGLVLAILSGIPSLLSGKPFLTGLWAEIWTPLGIAKLGTPLVFDLGVFLVVIGTTTGFIEDMHRE